MPQNIALLAFSLGIVFTTGLQLATAVLWTKAFVWSASTEAQDLPAQSLLASARAPMMGAYLSCWATFHMLEFVVTAKYNAEKLSVSCECHRGDENTRADKRCSVLARQRPYVPHRPRVRHA